MKIQIGKDRAIQIVPQPKSGTVDLSILATKPSGEACNTSLIVGLGSGEMVVVREALYQAGKSIWVE